MKKDQNGLFFQDITRRNFLGKGLKGMGLTAGICCGLGRPIFLKRAAASDTQITFCSWGGEYQDKQREFLLKPFEQETGIAVNEATLPLASKVKAMVDTGNIEWDVVEQDMLSILSLQKKGEYFEKIDYNMIDPEVLKKIPEKLQTPYGIGCMYWTYSIAYRTDAFEGEHPNTWADVWDVERFPGKRTLTSAKGGQYPNLEFAVLADGVPVEKIYPIDMDRAFRSLDKIKPHILQWWDSGNQPGQLLIGKEITCGSAYSGRIFIIKEKGAPVDVEYNQSRLDADYLAIVKGSKNYEAAMKFINFSLKSKNQANLFNHYLAGPANMAAFDHISKDRATKLPSYPENMKKMFMADGQWWADHVDEAFEKFSTWVLT
jgi:putative spermidine/putrescine transport system substrate-binding protein